MKLFEHQAILQNNNDLGSFLFYSSNRQTDAALASFHIGPNQSPAG
jgi:hypothetical protein